MGTSTDGILFYGIDLPELEDNHDAYEILEYLFPMDCPLELVMYCSYAYPMFGLSIRGFQHQAARGDCYTIDVTGPPKDVVIEAQGYLDSLDLSELEATTYDEAPINISLEDCGWKLVSMWG